MSDKTSKNTNSDSRTAESGKGEASPEKNASIRRKGLIFVDLDGTLAKKASVATAKEVDGKANPISRQGASAVSTAASEFVIVSVGRAFLNQEFVVPLSRKSDTSNALSERKVVETHFGVNLEKRHSYPKAGESFLDMMGRVASSLGVEKTGSLVITASEDVATASLCAGLRVLLVLHPFSQEKEEALSGEYPSRLIVIPREILTAKLHRLTRK